MVLAVNLELQLNLREKLPSPLSPAYVVAHISVNFLGYLYELSRIISPVIVRKSVGFPECPVSLSLLFFDILFPLLFCIIKYIGSSPFIIFGPLVCRILIKIVVGRTIFRAH